MPAATEVSHLFLVLLRAQTCLPCTESPLASPSAHMKGFRRPSIPTVRPGFRGRTVDSAHTRPGTLPGHEGPEKPDPRVYRGTQTTGYRLPALVRQRPDGAGTSHIPAGSSLPAVTSPCHVSPPVAASQSLTAFLGELSSSRGETAAWPPGKDVGSEVRRGRCAPASPRGPSSGSRLVS